MANHTNYRHGDTCPSAVLLINLGTPAKPTARSVRRYLKRFLSDPRVVEIPRLFWLPILYLLVLTLRPARVAKLYQKIWTAEGSPLLVHTLEQACKLEAALFDNGIRNVIVKPAMCYSTPDVEQAIADLQRANVKKLLVFPMYPQYSATTTGATFDLVTRALQRYRWLPEIRFIHYYHDHPRYIEACAAHIRKMRGQTSDSHKDSRKLLFSFHGLPKANLLKGDPYHCYCHATARLIAEALELDDDDWTLSFQSRFGRAEWLQPYTDKTLRSLPAQGVKKIDVFCPGFVADCLETLEEIAMQNRNVFMEAGGTEFRYIPALNAEDAHIECLTELVKQHTAGWGFGDDNADEREKSRQRALAKGAEE